MGHRIKRILGHWQQKRTRTKKLRKNYREYDRNRTILENGKTLPDMEVIRRCGGFREYANDHIKGPIL